MKVTEIMGMSEDEVPPRLWGPMAAEWERCASVYEVSAELLKLLDVFGRWRETPPSRWRWPA